MTTYYNIQSKISLPTLPSFIFPCKVLAEKEEKNVQFPVLVIVNGKCYSSSYPPAHYHLRFTLSLHHEPITGTPELMLRLLAPRDIWPAINPARINDHPIPLFFPAKGVFNYKYLSAAESKASITRFGVPMEKKDAKSGDDHESPFSSAWRILEFAAEEMELDAGAIEGVPRLRNDEAEALVKRLLGTVQHAVETPGAVLEVKCLIYGADATTDDAISELEAALIHPPQTPPATTLSSPSKRSPITNWTHLKVRYQDAQDAKHSPSASFTSTTTNKNNNNSSSSSSNKSEALTPTSQSPEKAAVEKKKKGHMFQNNSPPTLRFLTPGKRVCFNCYDVGHPEEACEKPKRALGNRMAVKKVEKMKDGKKYGGGGGGGGIGSVGIGGDDDDDDGNDVNDGGANEHRRKHGGKDDVVKTEG